MDPREEFESLTLESRAAIEVVAITLANFLSALDPKLKLKPKSLLCKALDAFLSARYSGKEVLDLEGFLVATMICFSQDLADNCLKQFAFGEVGLTMLEHDLHVRELFELVQEEVIANDREASMIWTQLLEGYSGPQIETMCDFPPGRVDSIKKRIRRRALIRLMAVLCHTRGIHDSQF